MYFLSSRKLCIPTRPPGHHAESYTCMGFCLFNNVAIAAKMAIEEYGVKRLYRSVHTQFMCTHAL